jgi:Domain of unknown function (DUF4397)
MGVRRMVLGLVGVIAAAAGGGVVATATVGHAQPEQTAGQVRVVHGLRGLVADVYLDGTLVLPTFRPERATDPLPIPAGDHLVEIRQAGAAATDEPLLTQQMTVPPGFVGSVVAHLDASGAATLTAFADDLSAVPPGQSRVVVRHAAEARPVNVLLNDEPTFRGVASNSEAGGLVAAGDYEVAVTRTRGERPLAAPQRVEYPEGTANFMYLIGSQADGTLGWAAVRVDNLATAPARIQTGDGSTEPTAQNDTVPVAVLVLIPIAAVLAGAVGLRVRLRRATS